MPLVKKKKGTNYTKKTNTQRTSCSPFARRLHRELPQQRW